MVSHPLSEIDRALFENTGVFFSDGGGLAYEATPPEAGPRLEARFDVEIAPLLHTDIRLVIYEKSL